MSLDRRQFLGGLCAGAASACAGCSFESSESAYVMIAVANRTEQMVATSVELYPLGSDPEDNRPFHTLTFVLGGTRKTDYWDVDEAFRLREATVVTRWNDHNREWEFKKGTDNWRHRALVFDVNTPNEIELR